MIERVEFTVRYFLFSQGIGMERETATYLSKRVYRGNCDCFCCGGLDHINRHCYAKKNKEGENNCHNCILYLKTKIVLKVMIKNISCVGSNWRRLVKDKDNLGLKEAEG